MKGGLPTQNYHTLRNLTNPVNQVYSGNFSQLDRILLSSALLSLFIVSGLWIFVPESKSKYKKDTKKIKKLKKEIKENDDKAAIFSKKSSSLAADAKALSSSLEPLKPEMQKIVKACIEVSTNVSTIESLMKDIPPLSNAQKSDIITSTEPICNEISNKTVLVFSCFYNDDIVNKLEAMRTDLVNNGIPNSTALIEYYKLLCVQNLAKHKRILSTPGIDPTDQPIFDDAKDTVRKKYPTEPFSSFLLMSNMLVAPSLGIVATGIDDDIDLGMKELKSNMKNTAAELLNALKK